MFRLSAVTKTSGIVKHAHGVKVKVLDSDRDHPFGERVPGEVCEHMFSGLIEHHGRRYLQVEVIEPGVYQSYVGDHALKVDEVHKPGQVLNYMVNNITMLEEVEGE